MIIGVDHSKLISNNYEPVPINQIPGHKQNTNSSKIHPKREANRDAIKKEKDLKRKRKDKKDLKDDSSKSSSSLEDDEEFFLGGANKKGLEKEIKEIKDNSSTDILTANSKNHINMCMKCHKEFDKHIQLQQHLKECNHDRKEYW